MSERDQLFKLAEDLAIAGCVFSDEIRELAEEGSLVDIQIFLTVVRKWAK